MKNEELTSLQHVQLPNSMTATKELDPKDLLIYVCIKRYMNKITKECFPSLDTIVNISGVSKPTVRKSIDKLKELEYIEVRREGRSNIYKFNSYKNFEPFSYAFLDKPDLSPNEKAYLIVSQQYMFKDIEGEGKITYTDSELAEKINMSYNSIVKYNKSLKEKGYLDIIKTSKKDAVTGLMVQEKMFHLNELEQAVVFALQNHEERIGKTETKVEALERQMKILIEENRQLKDSLLHKTNEITL
jgi:DNA-binding transcriptional ArsR family regulator